MLKLDQVQAGYGAIEVLKNLDLEVRGHEIVALLGANGAGKSTTLLTIAGVVRLRAGRIEWQGEPLPAGPTPSCAAASVSARKGATSSRA
jgi:branched-chain amino acid transport system ATP-binding protein